MPKLSIREQVSSHTGTKDSDAVSLSIKDIPIEAIVIKDNIRAQYNGIDELKASIRQHGLLQPITVYKDGDGYSVKTGHRRYIACRQLYQEAPQRFHSIRCIISGAENIAIIQLVENVQRVDLSQFDLFNTLTNLKKQGLTLKQIADLIGKSEASLKVIFTGINEIKRDPDLKAFIQTPGGKIRDVVDTKGIPNREKRLELLEQRKEKAISQKELREKARALKDPPAPAGNAQAHRVFLTINKAERNILITFEEDASLDIISKDIKRLIERANLVCVAPGVLNA
jgi:ParB family chromosome partitioning protein